MCVGVVRMRLDLLKQCSAVALAGLLFMLTPSAANAQGFFEQLFGVTPKSKPMPSLASPPGQGGYGRALTPGGRAYPARDIGDRRKDRRDESTDEPGESGTYRTLCVRMCDGYYFPISNSTTKKNFYRDQGKCKSTCGGEARLFVTPTNMSVSPSASMENMVDLNGVAYARLPVAFRYRKTLVAGCQCKPEPWSDAELNRHRRYAEAETTAKLAVTVAANEPSNGDQAKVQGEQVAVKKPGRQKNKDEAKTVIADAANPEPSTRTPTPPASVDKKLDDAALIRTAKSNTRQSRVATSADGVKEPPKVSRIASKSVPPRPVTTTAWTQAPSAKVSGGLFSGGMGLGAGGSAYAWPGDTQRR
jgi:hypothetical protein